MARGPLRLEPRKTAGESVGRFLEGLNSLAAGDRAGAERATADIGRTRQAALAEAEDANQTAKAEYDSMVAAARLELLDAARLAYRAADAAARNVRGDASEATARRERTSRDYEESLTASWFTFVDLVEVTRVFGSAELREVERAAMAGALSAVAQVSQERAGDIALQAASRAVDSAFEEGYGERRKAAVQKLHGLQTALNGATAAAACWGRL